MSAMVTNAGRGRFLARATYLVPIVLMLFGTLGVTIRPSLDMASIQLELSEARDRLDRYEVAAGDLEALLDEATEQRLVEIDRAYAAFLPERPSTPELHGALRFLAERAGLMVEQLSLGPVVDLESEALGRGLGLQEVSLSGSGTFQALDALVGSLRRHGYPTAVLSFSLARVNASQTEFDLRLRLGMLHTFPAVEAEDDSEDDSEDEA